MKWRAYSWTITLFSWTLTVHLWGPGPLKRKRKKRPSTGRRPGRPRKVPIPPPSDPMFPEHPEVKP